MRADILLNDAKDLIIQSGKELPPEVEEKILVLLNAAGAYPYISRSELAKGYRALGDCYCKHGIYLSALEQYQRSLRLYPKLPIKQRMQTLEKLPDKTKKSSIPPDIIKDVFIYPEYEVKLLDCTLKRQREGSVKEEDYLPYRYVYYPTSGAFLGFQEYFNGPIYLCECSRKAVYGYFKYRKMKNEQEHNDYYIMRCGDFPYKFVEPFLEVEDMDIQHLMDTIPFKPGLCHRCNNEVGKFANKYEWYIKQRKYKLGIVDNPLIPDKELTPPDIYEVCLKLQEERQLLSMFPDWSSDPDIQPKIQLHQVAVQDYKRKISDYAEDSVRVEFCLKKLSERWVSESKLFHIVEHIYPRYNVRMHYRPNFLEGLEYDIFVDELNLGIEYQGIQHYKPVDYWGGQAALEKQQQRDEKKKKISKRVGVTLVYFNYNESIEEPFVRRRLNAALDK